MEPVLALGAVRPGLGAEAAKRGLRLVGASEGARAGVHFGHDATGPAGVPMLHVVAGDDAAVAAVIDAGADDAVATSASDALIAARLAALVRRTQTVWRVGPLEIDRAERCVTRQGRPLDLLPREYRLLLHLAERAGRTITHEDLRRAVWGLRFHPGTNVVAVHISRLRAKLDRAFDTPLLLTEKGVGYRLAMAGGRGIAQGRALRDAPVLRSIAKPESMMNDRVSTTIAHHIADVRLTRADKMNAIDPAMFVGIGAAIDALRPRKDVRCVILSGEGKGFCAGLDMTSMAGGGSGVSGRDRNDQGAILPQHVTWGWRNLPMPVIAAVHGVAFGGGFQIMSGADIRIAAPGTRFSIRESYWGLVPDMAGFPIWRGLVRDDVLRELVYTAREFGAEEALHHGFITRVAEDPRAAAQALAQGIAAKSPNAIRGAKRLCNMAHDADPQAMLEAETREQIAVIGQPPMMEQVAANIQKRPAHFGDAD